jgi:phosphate:Na+ symporter
VLKKILLPTIYILFAYGFWVSPDFGMIAAGVAIFLFGMLALEQGFKSMAGGALENILRRSTSNIWKSLSFGMVSTTLLQSSSLVSVITISFLSAGLIDLLSGIGILLGASLGTTTGAWLIAGFGLKVKISAYAMPLLVFGVLALLQDSKRSKTFGYIITGIGFLFLGIHYMKEGLDTFKDTVNLNEYAIPGILGLLTYTVFGILATILMQSSHATLVLTITALSTNHISYDNAIALTIGSNVGTTITAIIGSMSANQQGKRLALAHVIFKLVTAIIAITFIQQLVSLSDKLSLFVGIHEKDLSLKLAMFHTLFNVLGICLFLPFVKHFERLLSHILKDKKVSIIKPRFLNQSSLDFPDTALEAIRNESTHLYQNAIHIITKGLNLQPSDINSATAIEDIVKSRDKVNHYNIDEAYVGNIKDIYSAIIEFISRAGFTWKMSQSGDIHWLRQANLRLVEAIKDIKHMQKNLDLVQNSNNLTLKNEYNQIRMMLLQVINQIEILRLDQNNQQKQIIKELKTIISDNYEIINKNLSRLIHENKITPSAGTSLMNDATYAFDIAKNLTKASETLFVFQRYSRPVSIDTLAEVS